MVEDSHLSCVIAVSLRNRDPPIEALPKERARKRKKTAGIVLIHDMVETECGFLNLRFGPGGRDHRRQLLVAEDHDSVSTHLARPCQQKHFP